MLHDFTQDKLDIIIQAGQSNAEGCSFGSADNPYQPDGRVWYLNQNGTITPATEAVVNNGIQSNFALPFAREYLAAGKLAPGRSLLVVRAAVGATGFLDNRWKLTDDLYLQMMDMIRTALSLNPENRLVALLWHQGETDASLSATYAQHYAHLMSLLQGVRTTFDVPDLPFVAGDFVPLWRYANAEMCAPVRAAMRAVCADCGHGAFVESDGLHSNAEDVAPEDHPCGWGADAIHFSRNGIYGLGKRYFEAFAEIVD